MNFQTILIRYGEIWLKSAQTRRKFVRRLVQNIKTALRADFIDYDNIRVERGRLYLETSDKEAGSALKRVFGIVSFSPAIYCAPKLDDIQELVVEISEKHVKKKDTFAIRASRSGKKHSFNSLDIAKRMGSVVRQVTKAKVDLNKPKKELFIEVRENRAYLFTKKIKGPAGLPLGIEGKAVGLYGKNVEEAAYMMARRGCDIEVVAKKNENLQKLGQWIPNLKVHQKVPKTAKALFTGDSIGKNPNIVKKFVEFDKKQKLPVFRPLVGLTAAEIKKITQSLQRA